MIVPTPAQYYSAYAAFIILKRKYAKKKTNHPENFLEYLRSVKS